MELGPTFFKDHYPNLVSGSRFSKQRLPLGIDRDIVINNNLNYFALIQNPGHINSVLINFQVCE
jgi:hypothetical protein